jgi:phytoene dehydrogenase-like protein
MLAENWKGFDKVVLERKALSPADLEQSNINLVDGAVQGGESTLTSLFLGRPFPGRPSHKTSVKGLWHIGAFTRPGAGLGARSGFKVAQYLSAPRGPRGIGARANAGRD